MPVSKQLVALANDKLRAQRRATIKRHAAERQGITKRASRLGPIDGEIADDNVGAWLQKVLVESGKSCTRIADAAELAPGTVSRIFYGETKRPSFKTVQRILAVNGVNMVMGRSVGRVR